MADDRRNRPVVVSACLVGLRTRYDGGDALSEEALNALKGRPFIPICPEQLGGLPTPRPKSVILGTGPQVLDKKALVRDEFGKDVTGAFLKGAEESHKIADMTGAREAFLKEKSPSCGVSLIYGENDSLVEGEGVTTALLKRKGIKVRGF